MIRTWIADVACLYEEKAYGECYKKLPDHRRAKADRIRRKEDRALSAGAWALYELAGSSCGAADDAVFNLSHSGRYVLCSIGDGANPKTKVGCDLEEIKKLHTKLIKRYFLPSEQTYILSCKGEEEQKKAFYRYWVLKESFMKATRYGMKLGLDTFEIACTDRGAELIGKPEEITGKFYFKEYELDIPYRAAVCSTDPAFAEKIEEVDLGTYWR